MKADFLPHGQCSFTVEGNIISIDATGPWNIEFFKKMHADLTNIIINNVDSQNFAVLLILRGLPLATKNALDYHVKLVSTGQTKALAIYSCLSESPAIAESIFQKAYSQAGLKNKSFDSIETAKVWLNSQLTKSF
ncbi:hypothetical protein [Colwellia polaris]|uniref:hypothetical protein n=1 Tax=Colwellia polaris TaxID=326537 RepID=UPI000A17879B|nr:hypothetical protein [Colwellia polaris]